MNRLLLAHLALFSTNLIYGLNYTLAKNVMPQYIQPFGFIFCRVSGALVLFWLFHSMLFKERVARADFPRLALCGLFGVALNQLLFFKGLNITSPINASIIMTTNPILVLVLAALIIRERITTNKVAGIAFGLVGALTLLLFNNSHLTFGSETVAGDLLVFLNATSYAIYLVLVKPLMAKYKPLTVIKWVFLFGFIVVLPVGWSEFGEIDWVAMPASALWETAFVVIGTTFLAYLFNIFALKTVSPSTASTYIYLQPLLAGLFAILMGKDSVNGIKIIATLCIFSGVYLVSKRQKVKQSTVQPLDKY
jgi:drug/metabolite transporter (DMT)-like permease